MSKKRKVTHWFEGTVKPARRGVYQREVWGEVRYARWDGQKWHLSWATLRQAANYDRGVTGLQVMARWRGLAENPAKKKGGKA